MCVADGVFFDAEFKGDLSESTLLEDSRLTGSAVSVQSVKRREFLITRFSHCINAYSSLMVGLEPGYSFMKKGSPMAETTRLVPKFDGSVVAGRDRVR
jgi:hypothetical protein